METSFTLTYKEEIEALKEYANFEELGDNKYMFHEDDEARLEWAFYRPSAFCPIYNRQPERRSNGPIRCRRLQGRCESEKHQY